MTLQRYVVGLSLLLTAGLACADGLAPRQTSSEIPDAAITMPEQPSGDLLVKFADSMRARAVLSGDVVSLSNTSLGQIEDVIAQHGLKFERAFRNKTDGQLRALEERAEAYSREAQPDLAGFLFATPTHPGALLQAAKELNGLPGIEFAIVYGIPTVPNWYGGDPDCGEPGTGDCFDDANGSPFCEDIPCCELICDLDPFCCAEDAGGAGLWDELCVDEANLICGGGDRCESGLNGSCIEVHIRPGCVNADCCNDVCAIDDFCCMATWDDGCVAIAADICTIDTGPGPTPDFEILQGYLNTTAYDDLPGGAPGELAAPAPNLVGFGGEGYDIEGLEAFAQELMDDYGIDATGDGVLTDGRTSKIGVIEWAFYEDHEDLDVVTEPGQTLIMTSWVTEPDHATAVFGIINAMDNGFGVTGIAPGADAYFFPLTSVEEGPRQLNAWVSMLEVFGEGDVVSCSYGGAGSLANSPLTNALINFASDLGILVCVSAGNDCDNLDDFNDINGLPDTGGITVGAGSPGIPHYRLTFSNFCVDCVDSGTVHLQGWGSNMASTGSGDLFFPDLDKNRAYSVRFNGTSSASPMVAGMCVAFQGLCRQIYGFPFPPTMLRTAVSRGYPQGGLNPRFTGGFDETQNCGIDADPDEGPNIIGPFTTLVGDFGSAAAYILNQDGGGFNQSPLLKEYFVTVGEALTDTSKFRVTGLGDGVVLKVQSERVDPGDQGDMNEIGDPKIGDIGGSGRLIGFGNTTQILVWGETIADNITTTTVNDVGQIFGTTFVFEIAELYDHQIRRWAPLGFTFGLVGTTMDVTAGAHRYWADVNNDGVKDLLAKFTQYSFPAPGGGIGGGGGGAGHIAEFDYVGITHDGGG